MTKFSESRRCKTFLTILLVVPFLFPADLCGDSQLGELSFSSSGSKARPIALEKSLMMRTSARPTGNTVDTMTASVNSYGFLGSVGGVAFGGVAEGEKGWSATDLHYDAARVDGNRLVVNLKGPAGAKRMTLPVYDWAFVPIARFAATDDVACFTLFGQLDDAAEQSLRTQRGGRVLAYHSAFRDTLMGLRLMQSDLLIIDPSACDLPKERGRYFLGPREQLLLKGGAPDVARNQAAFRAVGTVLARAPAKFQSYVVCDAGQEVKFHVQGKDLVMTGDPSWYCWRSRISDQKTLQDLQRTAFNKAQDKWKPVWDRELNSLGSQAFERKWPQEKRQAELQSLVDQTISANVIQPMPELSDQVSAEVWKQDGVNPVVAQALRTTMRLSALFRHVRRADPKGYERFVESLRNVRASQDVATPDFMAGRSSGPVARPSP